MIAKRRYLRDTARKQAGKMSGGYIVGAIGIASFVLSLVMK